MDILKNFFDAEHIAYSDETFALFNRYYELLIETNKVMNLTAIVDYEDVQIKHFIDSLYAVRNIFDNSTVLDVGAGAGFPGIPLAIMRPDCRFTLVDSLNKRVKFINDAAAQLNLTNVKAIHSRAEDLPKKIKYDFAVARAVAPLNVLLEYVVPFVKIGGKALIYKASSYVSELEDARGAMKLLKTSLTDTSEYELFSTDNKRALLTFTKLGDTDPIYPRQQNRPRTNPL